MEVVIQLILLNNQYVVLHHLLGHFLQQVNFEEQSN